MAIRSITRMYDDGLQAHAAIRDLEEAGFSHDEVSLMSSKRDETSATTTHGSDETHSGTGAGTGATLGTLVGGGAGLLAGLGALAIPGVGPIVAAGWLVAAITGAGAGAAAGGLLGGLVGSGVEERDAHVYAEGVRRGGHLVMVRADDTRLAQAETILERHHPVDMASRESEYRSSGWSGYAEDGTTGATTSTASHTADRTTTSAYLQGGGAAIGTGAALGPDGLPTTQQAQQAGLGTDPAANTNISGAHPLNERRSG